MGPLRGLTRRGKGCLQAVVAVRGKIGVGPTLMIQSTTATVTARALAKNAPQPAANPLVHVRERRVITVLEVAEPTPPRSVPVVDNARQRTPIRSLRLRAKGVLELGQALPSRPTRQATP